MDLICRNSSFTPSSFLSQLFFLYPSSMDNRIYFRLGGKSYNLTETRSSSDIWYEWVESAKPFLRRMKISKGTLMWLCNRFKEASVIKGKSFKTWKCKDISISIYCSLKFNKFGRFISVIQLMAMIGLSLFYQKTPLMRDGESWL